MLTFFIDEARIEGDVPWGFLSRKIDALRELGQD